MLSVPVASGRILEPAVLWASLVAFACFCAISSAVYLLNDVRDVDEDRRHPTKRLRPVAAGELSPTAAVITGGLLAALGLGLAFWWALPLGLVIVGYLLLQLAYGLGLKGQPVLDMAVVASGFVLRVVAGGAATSIEMSSMLLLVAAFGSMFMVAGKRYSEMRQVADEGRTRPALEEYSESYLRFAWTMAATVTILTYVLWALTQATGDPGDVRWGVVSVAPFVLGMLRYALDIDRGAAGAPEEVVLGDRSLQVFGVVWLATVLPGLLA